MGEGFVGVILGGIIAILSAAVAPTIQHYLSKKTRLEDARRTNQEALVNAVYELDHWSNRLRENCLIGREEVTDLSPLAKIESLVLIHFPEANAALEELSGRFGIHRVWMLEKAQERAKGMPVSIDDMRDTYAPFHLAQRNLIRAVTGQVPLDAK